MLKNKTGLMVMVMVLISGVQSVHAITGPYIFDWSIRDAVDPNFSDYIPVPLPGHDRSPFFPSLGGPETLHPYYTALFDLMNTQGKPRAFMLVNNSNPVDGNDPDTHTLGYDNVIQVVDAYAQSKSFPTSFDMIFADFETWGVGQSVADSYTTVMVTEAKALNPNVYAANYADYPGITDNSRTYSQGSDRTARSTFYGTSGQNVAMPNCYPYYAYEDHYVNPSWGSNKCPNVRSALLWAPLEKFSVAKRALPAGHLLIPWTARFIPNTPTNTVTPPTREDVVALIQHFRLRGADGFYRLQSTGLIDWTVDPAAYYADENENRSDMINAWKSLNAFYAGSGTVTILNTNTAKTSGVQWSGVNKGSRTAILISNLGNTAASISLPGGYGLPATSDVIPAGTHQLKLYDTISPSMDVCVGANGRNTAALYSSWAPTIADSQGVYSYLKFDVNSLASSDGFLTSITSLKLQATVPAGVGSSYTDAVFGITTDTWTDSAITWANKPAVGTQLATWSTAAGALAISSADLTKFVKQQANGDKVVSLAIRDLNVTHTSAQYQHYYDFSESAANCFKLVVEYKPMLVATPSSTAQIVANDVVRISEFGYRDSSIVMTGGSFTYGLFESYLKFDLNALKPSQPGYKTVVDTVEGILWQPGNSEDYPPYQDQLFAVSDDEWSSGAITWATKPAKGTYLTTWPFVFGDKNTAPSTPAWLTLASNEVNGDGVMSLCMSGEGILSDDTRYHSYYGLGNASWTTPALTISYHQEIMPEPTNCTEAIAQRYGFTADINSDCSVNLKDFAIFAENWMK